MAPAAVDLLAVDRGVVREGTHAGHLVVSDAAGRLQAALGDVGRTTYYRSCLKPLQALAALRTGIQHRFDLQEEQIAIMCASHNGEPRHLATVRSLLARCDVPESALQCGAHWPYDEAAALEARRTMAAPLAVFNNCSGKHAGMLAASLALGAPLESYLEPTHPLQQAIRGVVEAYTGCAASEIAYGIDGCSAPNPAAPLKAIARSLAALAQDDDPIARGIVAAMTAHPYLVGGTGRFDTRLMEATHGRLLAKGGATGLHCTVDRRSGQALAVKLESGDGSFTSVAVMAALSQLGWLEDAEAATLADLSRPVLKNHRQIAVGAVRPLFRL
ncbi:MAG TPA: asparaginase [Candidatus Limnocylindrales bacterium]|nr:asparaginase [Candidatus Limnocylindrales bacterium]